MLALASVTDAEIDAAVASVSASGAIETRRADEYAAKLGLAAINLRLSTWATATMCAFVTEGK